MKNTNFSVMCVGDDPMGIMSRYDRNRKVEEHVKYRFEDAGRYREAAILTLEKMLENRDKFPSKGDDYFEIMKLRLENLKRMSNLDYYLEMTEGMNYDENNNALTDENEEGRWTYCYSIDDVSGDYYPLELKDGTKAFSSVNEEISWSNTNLSNEKIAKYSTVWDMVVDGKIPETEDEKMMFRFMQDKKDYLLGFGTKEKYVKYSTAYWCTAFVDKDGWHDVTTDSHGDYEDWILNFYDRFIKKLSPKDKVTILGCDV